MPGVIFTRAAVRDIERVVEFLEEKNSMAAMDAKERIGKAVVALSEFPEIGRVVRNIPETREFSADYGKSGYVFRYRKDDAGNLVVLRIWHGREDR